MASGCAEHAIQHHADALSDAGIRILRSSWPSTGVVQELPSRPSPYHRRAACITHRRSSMRNGRAALDGR